MAQANSAVVDASSVQIRFEPMGPDVYGQNQPQELLAAIAEDVEPLKDLVDQHVVSIQPFRPEALLQVFRLAAKFESNPDRYCRHNTPLTGKILINAFYEPARARGCLLTVLGTDSAVLRSTSPTGPPQGLPRASLSKMSPICSTTTAIVWCFGTAIPVLFMR
jgi:aspartate carbamoyltransferase catalytic subunit